MNSIVAVNRGARSIAYSLCHFHLAYAIWHMPDFRRTSLSRAEFYRVAVRVAYEELRIASAPAAVTDLDANFAKFPFRRLNVGNAERDVAVVARRIGVAG